MAENSNIEWCDHSLNFWTGCEPISPACASCYAESWAKRAGRVFSERRQTTEATRGQAFKYQRDAERFAQEHGRRQRVFVNSLSDWADNKVPQAWRDDIFETARACSDVDFLLLTKRIGNAVKMLPADWIDQRGRIQYPNIWIGATVVTQEEADRDIPKLLRTPAETHFLSIEPMLDSINLRRLVLNERVRLDALTGYKYVENIPTDPQAALDAGMQDGELLRELLPALDWIIAGGESGPQARPMHPAWLRYLRDQ